MTTSISPRANDTVLEENYKRWKNRPETLDPIWKAFFEGFELGCAREEAGSDGQGAAASADAHLQTRVDALVYAYRTMGHTIADLDPLDDIARDNPLLSLKELGFEEKDLDLQVSSRFFRDGRVMSLRDMIAQLRAIYSGTVGAEFVHIQNPRVRNWVRDRFENRDLSLRADATLHRQILRMLTRAEAFEAFLHSTYVGNKRFSLEGGEALIVALEAILEGCPRHGVLEIVMGMAHRGRLNVLANFLHKPLELIFNEFHGTFDPDLVGGNGDVKYHLGYNSVRVTSSGEEVEIRLAANPSHLEAVDPVVQGRARARQRVRGDTEHRKKVLPLLVHGDAAFIGQGVVAETFNLSQLAGYRTGGTVHIVVNNQIGFTTMPADARSSPYCTDIAKMVEAPVFHINGEDPLAVIEMARLALDFRQEFGRDVVLDIYCYRRHGHNEGDEPSFTQPNLYSKIKNHPPPSRVFLDRIAPLGTISKPEAEAIHAEAVRELGEAFERARKAHVAPGDAFAGSSAVFQLPYTHDPVITTAITPETLAKIVRALTTVPEGFRVHPKIKRILLDRRRQVWEAGGPYNWAFAEALAFGALLLEGTPVRLSGQDSRRGTFSQRHSVLYDEITRERYIPLMHIGENQARFCVYNSPLSEFAVLGFDYGYSLDFPEMLCIWEAQFGDFANGAQVIIDQFIASGESKWKLPSSIVLLLPHGYEGQGPEHSSARLERFLQLCAEENMQVCNLTTPAQYFHALRRQVHRAFRKPLVIMTPKSLLNHEEAVSREEDFTKSRFYGILEDPSAGDPEKVERLIFCSGKVYYDLVKFRREHPEAPPSAIIRIEQLYPLNEERLRKVAEPFARARKLVWCQEEPENMGAWFFILPRLLKLFGGPVHYAGRPPSASTATGIPDVHASQQAALVRQAFEV